MNTVVTSKEAILAQSRKLVMEEGISAVNMRSVANRCGVAVGSIYNYFPSKTALICAAVEEVWKDIFHITGEPMEFSRFTDCLLWLYESVKKGCARYPGFFTLHSVSFAAQDKAEGRQLMEHYFQHMKESLLKILEEDSTMRQGAFDESFTKEAFVDIMLIAMNAMLLKGREDCGALVEMASRCIY